MENLDKENLREKLEEMKMSENDIDELMVSVSSTPVGDNSHFYKMFKVQELKKELLAETDWRKKAALCAKLISLDLE